MSISNPEKPEQKMNIDHESTKEPLYGSLSSGQAKTRKEKLNFPIFMVQSAPCHNINRNIFKTMNLNRICDFKEGRSILLGQSRKACPGSGEAPVKGSPPRRRLCHNSKMGLFFVRHAGLDPVSSSV
jgi:hypothetical protein